MLKDLFIKMCYRQANANNMYVNCCRLSSFKYTINDDIDNT